MIIQFAASFLIVLFSIFIALNVAPIMTWVERRQVALVQRRVGPNRVGIFQFRLFGLMQPVADSIKLLFKEDFIPPHVNAFFYVLAPMVPAIMGMTALTAIPFGSNILIGEQVIPFVGVHVNAGFLFIFAISALGVYGAALAGWSSNNKYALLGGLRASAQMISYEVAMGMSLIPIVLVFGTLDLQAIVGAQADHLLFGFLPNWGIFYAPLSFLIFIVTIFAETNRLPFDLAEGEAELVAGFLVEYGAMRWSLFFLGEYAMMTTLSGLTVCLFLGGYEIPYLPQTVIQAHLATIVGLQAASWVGAAISAVVLLTKIAVFLFFYSQVRWTLPRFRYDQLMNLGWKFMLPLSLANLVVTALIAGAIKFH